MTNKEAIEVLQKIRPYRRTNRNDPWAPTVLEAIKIGIDALQEQKQGKWGKEIKGNGWSDWAVLTCDQCGAVIEDPRFKTNYCPVCGAHME